jgi:hypothetical protein
MVYLARANPTRTCLGCGRHAPQSQLLRLFVGESGVVDADPDRRSGGRGAYLCFRVECLWEARKKNRFGRALRNKGPVDDAALGLRIAGRLREKMLRRLHTARRANAVVPGPGVDVPAGEVCALVVADGWTAPPERAGVPVIAAGPREPLALALQSPGATHAVVLDESLARELEAIAAARIDFLRTPPPRAPAQRGRGPGAIATVTSEGGDLSEGKTPPHSGPPQAMLLVDEDDPRAAQRVGIA